MAQYEFRIATFLLICFSDQIIDRKDIISLETDSNELLS